MSEQTIFHDVHDRLVATSARLGVPFVEVWVEDCPPEAAAEVAGRILEVAGEDLFGLASVA